MPLKDVGKYLSITGLIWVLADVAGPLLGGAFSQYAFFFSPNALPTITDITDTECLQICFMEMVFLDQPDDLANQSHHLYIRTEAPETRSSQHMEEVPQI